MNEGEKRRLARKARHSLPFNDPRRELPDSLPLPTQFVTVEKSSDDVGCPDLVIFHWPKLDYGWRAN